MKHALFIFLSIAVLGMVCRGEENPVYLDHKAPVEDRVADLLGRLTLEEKISLLAGLNTCTTRPIPRLQIPVMRMADAGAGVRGIDRSNTGPATSFTCGVMMASTWDPILVGKVAAAIGEEARNKGAGSQILLGPAVNIQRSPLGGRNGEYFSEDPYLAGRMAVDYIKGMQGTGIAACIKHFACNNEEADRELVDVRVSERALREIYLPAFEAGVTEGHPWTLMSSYNRVNGLHSSANAYLLNDVLKKGWGFDGMVISDWGGVHQVASPLNAGNDLEMPGPGERRQEQVQAALQNGQTSVAVIDASVQRILRTMIRTGLLDGAWKTDAAVVNSPAHQKLSRELAEQGIVLLKNQNNILPLDATKIHSIAVVGVAAKKMQIGALGSPEVTPFYTVGPLEGITKRVGEKVTVRCVATGNPVIPSSFLVPAGNESNHGLRGEYFANRDLQGVPAQVRTDSTVDFEWAGQSDAGVGPDNFSVRWLGRLVAPVTGHYQLSFTADDGCRLYLDGKLIVDHWVRSAVETESAGVDLVAGKSYDLKAEYFQAGANAVAKLQWMVPGKSAYSEAVEAARNSDVAVVFVSTHASRRTEGEGMDRPSMSLPEEQDDLVKAVVAANPKTIVVLNNGTPIDMRPWVDQVPGLIEAWFPGQEGGNALAGILFGDVNPSGKLPTTFGLRREDYPDYGNFPGVQNRVNYAEGIYVGYRHFDKDKIAPLFPFGHGLSYTSFLYGTPTLSSPTLAADGKLSVSVPVTNSGSRAGKEVVQLYIHDLSPQVDKPIRELKGFSKIALAPGESKTVSLSVTPRDLAYFDVDDKQWKADAGDYEIEIGSSSRDIRQTAKVHLEATFTEAVPLSTDYLALNNSLGKSAVKDLALNRPVQASSVAEAHSPQNAVDGNDLTSWNSENGSDPQWIMVDLGPDTRVNRVRLFWGKAYALAYSVQSSGDGQAWTDLFTTTDGQGDVEWIKFKPTRARWIRVMATKPGTPHGYSLYTLEAYGP